jgi:hypothetical protein
MLRQIGRFWTYPDASDVLPQPEEGGVAQDAVVGPPDIADLGDELGPGASP